MGIVYFRVRARVRVKVGVRVDSSEIYLTAHLSQQVMHTEPQKWLRSAQLSLDYPRCLCHKYQGFSF